MTGRRSDLLTTTQMFHLDRACELVTRAFGTPPYLVGSAGADNDGSGYRDVDVRLMLPDDEFDQVCPTQERWELLSLAIGVYLAERTGLPVDFQVQRMTEAAARHGKGIRNPLGLGGRAGQGGRRFAGGGDGTPEWGTG